MLIKVIVLFLAMFLPVVESWGAEEQDRQNTREPASDDDDVQMEEMVVTGTGREQSLAEVPVSITVIDSKELKRSTAATTGDLLKDVPGVEILDTGVMAGQKRIMIRGESGSRVQLMVDGQKISEQKAMDGAALLMDMNNLERAEVLKGPSSVLYGSEGLGGVVNFVTKKEGNRPAQLDASSAFNGNTNGWNNYISIYGGGEKLGGFGYRLSQSYADHGNQHGSDDKELRHTDYDNSESNAYLSYDFGVLTNVDIKVSAMFSRYESNTNAFLYQDPLVYDFATPPAGWSPYTNITGEPYFTFQDMKIPKWDRDKDALFFEWNHISENLDRIELSGYRQNTFKQFVAQPFVAPGGWYRDNADWMDSNRYAYVNFRIDTRNDQDTENVALKTNWFFFNSHNVTAGADYASDDLAAVNYMTYLPGSMISGFTSYGTKDTYVDANRLTKSLYVLDEWNFLEDWLFSAGLRYTEADSEVTRNETFHQHMVDPVLDPVLLAKCVQDELDSGSTEEEAYANCEDRGFRTDLEITGKPADTSSEYQTSYQFGLVNNSITNLSLRASCATAFVLPTLSQLYVWSSQSGQTTKPNPDLVPEEAVNYEVGARYSTDRWDIDLSLYTMNAEDYIEVVSVTGDPEVAYQYQNISEVRSSGIELALSYTYEPWGLTPYVSGHYMRREFTYSNDFSTYDTGSPLLQGRFGLRYKYQLGPKSELWADLYGRSAGSAMTVYEDATESHVAGWETANLSCGLDVKKWLPWDSNAQLIVDINNIFDRQYLQAYQKNIEAMGRSAAVRLVTTF